MSSIAFLGAGNIAQAIMGGLIQSGTSPAELVAFDPVEACRQKAASLGIALAASNDEAVNSAGIILLCVKPNVLLDLLTALQVDTTGKVFVSVAAGVTTAQIRDRLGPEAAVIRCMPNTPALVQTGMTALFATSTVSSNDQAKVAGILGTVGQTRWLTDESDLDAVTAVSGSGPAYFFLLMECMIEAAQAEGLDPETATQLVLQTALGAARMAMADAAAPATLRENVTSPGGTTQAAVQTLLDGGLQALVNKAVHAARTRSEELSSGA